MKVKRIARRFFVYSKFIETTVNEKGREVGTFEQPILLEENAKPVSGDGEYAIFGQRALQMLRAIVPNTYQNRQLYKRFSLAYFIQEDDETNLTQLVELTGDEFSRKANFVLTDVREINLSIHLYFELRTKKQ